MKEKRIIPCLDINNGRVVKGVKFENLVDAGNPVEIAKAYELQGADELVLLDINATDESRKKNVRCDRKDSRQHIYSPNSGGRNQKCGRLQTNIGKRC